MISKMFYLIALRENIRYPRCQRKIATGWTLVRVDNTVFFCLWLRSEFTHVCPFCERLHVLVPRYLHANWITLHAIEVGVLGRGAVKEFAPEQLSVQRQGWHRLLDLKQYRLTGDPRRSHSLRKTRKLEFVQVGANILVSSKEKQAGIEGKFSLILLLWSSRTFLYRSVSW